ncbi:MAG: GNAT family N-acetyltransferase, partial [Planctomycetes bacterium]|nr:GNAT family N-acetyltransferase [Planctomycetota bacterium]
MIKPLKKEHAVQVARLHIIGIPTGFISSLGEKFMSALYESIAQSPYGFGLVEEIDGKVVGFVAFTTNLKGLYKSIMKKSLFRFGFLLFGKLFSFRTIKKILETLFYPSRVETQGLPKAELLSIAVAESGRGKGVGKQLVQRGLAECRSRGILKVKVLVADFNEPANTLYQKTGFKVTAQIENHGIVSNVYVV